MCYSTVLWDYVSGSNNKLLSYILLQSLWDIAGYVFPFFFWFFRWRVFQYSVCLFILSSVCVFIGYKSSPLNVAHYSGPSCVEDKKICSHY